MQPVTCKNCNSGNVIKYGSYKGLQRYYCKDCQRKFKADSSPFHMKVEPSLLSGALNLYYTGSSITDISNYIRQETDYSPSKSVVFKWIEKYTAQASSLFKNTKPKVGNTWIADETMIDVDKGKKVWFWDIIDADTRFLLASRVSLTRTTDDVKSLIRQAVKKAGKTPKLIITDALPAYPDGINLTLGKHTEHLQSKPFTIASESTNKIERFHETLKERTKIMKAFRDIETLLTFIDGFLAYYNYLKPHESLNGKTPAQEAKIKYQYTTWADVVNAPVSKKQELSTHQEPRLQLPESKVETKGAYKRKQKPRKPKPQTQKALPIAGVKDVKLDSPMPARVKKQIFGKMPKGL